MVTSRKLTTGIKALLEIKPSKMHRNWAFSKEVKAEPLTTEMLERQMQKAKESYDKPWEPIIYLSAQAYETIQNANKPELIDTLLNGDWDVAVDPKDSASKPKD